MGDLGSGEKPVISKFTLALLKDTNWYTEIDLENAEPIFWGHRKGCEFYFNACHSNLSKFDEFPEK